MKHTYSTERLLLTELSLDDAEFIHELVNTPEWKKFIGERNVNTREDAEAYIQKILENPNIHYRVVKLKDDLLRIGIITFIKRDYLEHFDLGFAFLPEHTGKGYAYEASRTVLNDVAGDPGRRRIFATTLKENINSIRLLGNLGFRFDKEIERENEKLLLYSLSIVIQHVTIKHTVEEVDPPHITSHFKTPQDWLFHICDSRKPKKSIATYRIGLFESPDDYVIFLVGLNTHTKGKNSYITRIGFKPSNMYFQLPKSEYENLSREQLIDQLASQLKDFITTEKFKTSFLAKAESINTDFGGQIWSK